MGLREIIDLRSGKAAVSPQGDHNIGILFKELIQQRLEKQMRITAAVFRPLTELRLEKVTCQTVKAQQWMESVALIMIVEAFTFLMAISLQERGVQIQEDVFRRPDPIDLMTENAEDLLKLEQGILIHTIEKTRYRGLGSKGVFAQDRAEHRIRGKLIRIVVIEVSGKDLINPLH
jgi:hypothetical protein